MLVGEKMTKNPVTVLQSASIDEALDIMRRMKVRRLPVVDKKGRMVGIVSELDLLKVSPSPATTLSIYEIPYLLSKIKLKDIMTRDVITVTEDTPLEEAARIMADHKIGGLPVLRGSELVGIITETDLFKIFLDLFAARQEGVRLSLLVPGTKGTVARITSRIAELGGNILALGTLPTREPELYQLMLKVIDVPEDRLVAAMQELGLQILDARYCTSPACND